MCPPAGAFIAVTKHAAGEPSHMKDSCRTTCMPAKEPATLTGLSRTPVSSTATRPVSPASKSSATAPGAAPPAATCATSARTKPTTPSEAARSPRSHPLVGVNMAETLGHGMATLLLHLERDRCCSHRGFGSDMSGLPCPQLRGVAGRRRAREGSALRHALEGEAEHQPNMPHRVIDAIFGPVAHRRLHRLKDVPRQQRDRHIPANLSVFRRRLEQPGHLRKYRGGGASARAQQRAVPYREAVDEPGELLLFQPPADRSFDHDNDLLLDRLGAGQISVEWGCGLGFSAKEALEQLGQDLLTLREVLVEG